MILNLNEQFSDSSLFVGSMQAWEMDFKQLTNGQAICELQQFGNQNLFITQFYLKQSFHQRGDSRKDSLTIGLIDEDSNKLFTPNRELTASSLLLFPEGKEFDLVTRQEFRGRTLSISRVFIEEVAESCGLDASILLSKTSQSILPGKAQKLTRFRHNLKKLGQTMNCQKHSLADVFSKEMEFNLVHQLLTATAMPEVESRNFLTARKRSVLNRALEYIDANLHLPVTIPELAKASGASIRALEYAFREYFDTTPKRYLRNLQLICLRRELQEVDQPTMIQDIASKWGLWHMGRLSKDYNTLFGELPSATLKKNLSRKEIYPLHTT
ncbi:MAG: helix-turn-helix domain-containing protein [Gammaproteobacteria bacterium]|nr:helix-turn-helix domain-containing protein [Gammaproteobacteria bacterium]